MQRLITFELKEIFYKGINEFYIKSKLQSRQHDVERVVSLCTVKPRKKTIFSDGCN